MMAANTNFLPPYSAAAAVIEDYISFSFQKALDSTSSYFVSLSDSELRVVRNTDGLCILSNGWSMKSAAEQFLPVRTGSYLSLLHHTDSLCLIWTCECLMVGNFDSTQNTLLVRGIGEFYLDPTRAQITLLNLVRDFCALATVVWLRSAPRILENVKGSRVSGSSGFNPRNGVSKEVLLQLYPPLQLLSSEFLQRAFTEVSGQYTHILFLDSGGLYLHNEAVSLLPRLDVASLGGLSTLEFWKGLYLLERVFHMSTSMSSDLTSSAKLRLIYQRLRRDKGSADSRILCRSSQSGPGIDEACREPNWVLGPSQVVSRSGSVALTTCALKSWIREKGFSKALSHVGGERVIDSMGTISSQPKRISRASGRKREQSDILPNKDILRSVLATAAEQALSFARNPSTASALGLLAKDAHVFHSFKAFIESLDARLPKEDDFGQVRSAVCTLAEDGLRQSLMEFGASDLLIGSKRLRGID